MAMEEENAGRTAMAMETQRQEETEETAKKDREKAREN